MVAPQAVIDFTRYLVAKKTVDDRAINRFVLDELLSMITAKKLTQPLRVLEVGCGIGTMVERLVAWDFPDRVEYLGIDTQPVNIQVAKPRFCSWASERGYRVTRGGKFLTLVKGELHWRIQFQVSDIKTFWSREAYQGYFDLLIAQAFLDLIDIPQALPNLARLLSPDGVFFFTLNFDGGTIFEPVSDAAREAKIIANYHQTMDERMVDGQPSGDSQTGRHLFTQLKQFGAEILAAGASDWVVHPGQLGYPADEAYFLRCILDFFAETLRDYPHQDPAALELWLRERRQQVDQGKLVYIAHQLDFLGRFNKEAEPVSR